VDDAVIRVESVSKTFKLPHERQSSIKGLITGIGRRNKGYEVQNALKNVSFDVKKGEFFGIVGKNGSGKSTLLKLLASIYTPTAGTVQVAGKLTPFIELGVGFNPELTGRENVFLNGALLGFTRKEMQAMYQEIVDFAELERFMDQRLKNYSSGMQVRLAFSIAIRAKSDILLLDEVLAVGDLDFQKKCYEYFVDIKRRKQTVILVTHDMSIVRRFCDRCIYIQEGILTDEGSPKKIAQKYEDLNLKSAEKRLSQQKSESKRDGIGGAEIVKAETFNVQDGKKQNTFNAGNKIGVRLECKIDRTIEKPIVGFIFQDEKEVTVFATNTDADDIKTKPAEQGQKLTMETVIDNVFTDGTYTITAAIEGNNFVEVYDRVKHLHKFMIGGQTLPHATTHPAHEIKLTYSSRQKK